MLKHRHRADEWIRTRDLRVMRGVQTVQYQLSYGAARNLIYVLVSIYEVLIKKKTNVVIVIDLFCIHCKSLQKAPVHDYCKPGHNKTSTVPIAK